MLLVIDIGNTNIVLGVYDGAALLAHWRVATVKTKTEDEYEILFLNLFKASNIDVQSVSGIIISSVVPPLTYVVESVARNCFHIAPLIVSPGVKTGMPILYDNPHEVGADRIVNAVAAFNRWKQSLIIVDFGTATTFDVVSENGEYMGGVIAPGIAISLDALFIHTSKLPRVELKKPKNVIGKNTVNSIQSGILHGYVGLVDGIVNKIISELSAKPKIIATGGLSKIIASESKTIESVEKNLTIEGLLLIWEMNQK